MVKNLPAMWEIQDTQVRSLGWEYPQEEDMATQFNILAWRITRTEEPAGLHRVHGVTESDTTEAT